MAHDVRRVLDAMLDGVVVISASGRVEQLNAEACRILNRSGETLRGGRVEQVLGEEHALARLAQEALSHGRSARESEVSVRGPGEADLTVDVAVSPLFDADNTLDGAVAVLRDRTLQRSLESQVAGRERLDAFGRIAAGLAHEIKNPLGGIRGAAELMALRSKDAKTHEAAQLVVREVGRITTLVDDFAVFSAGEALRLEETNLHRVLDGVLDLLAVDPIGAGVEVERSYDPSIPEFLADPDRLTQVFLNLARNALQAMESDGGELTIQTGMALDSWIKTGSGERTPGVAIEVRDTGTGIPRKLLEQVRTPFFTTRAGGTGLGLAVAEYWTARHEGTLRIDSVPGHGTSVRILLPLRRKP